MAYDLSQFYCDSYHLVDLGPDRDLDGPYLCSLMPGHDSDHEAHNYVGGETDHRNDMPMVTWPQRAYDDA